MDQIKLKGMLSATIIYLFSFWVTNFFILLLAPFLTPTIVKGLILSRDLFIIILLILVLPRKIQIHKLDFVSVGLIFLIIALLINFFGHFHLSKSSLIYIRLLLFPWLFLFTGKLQSKFINDKTLSNILNIFRIGLILFAGVSLILFLFRNILLSCYAWERFASITLKSFYSPKYCLLKNAISYDLYKYVKWGIPRLFGLVLDPPIAGIILSFSTIFIFIKRRYPWLELIPLVALLFTLSKGAFYIAFLSIALIITTLLGNKCCKQTTIKTLKIFSFIFFTLLFMLPFLLEINIAQSITSHLKGLKNGLVIMLSKPLGAGLGTYGNFAPEWTPVRESFLGAIAAQLGTIGFIGFIITTLGFLYYSIKALEQGKLTLFIILFYFFIFLTSSFFSESTISISGSSFIFYLSGLAYGIMNKTKLNSYS